MYYCKKYRSVNHKKLLCLFVNVQRYKQKKIIKLLSIINNNKKIIVNWTKINYNNKKNFKIIIKKRYKRHIQRDATPIKTYWHNRRKQLLFSAVFHLRRHIV